MTRLVLSIAWTVAVAVITSLFDTVFCGEPPATSITERHITEIGCIRPPATQVATEVPTRSARWIA
jgi:hypothetical protein